jgi:hypothetical protein
VVKECPEEEEKTPARVPGFFENKFIENKFL